MAVVKLKYLKARPQLKRHLRYITHRRGKEAGRVTRQLFDRDGPTDRRTVEFIPIMVYWASHERRHPVWPVYGSPMCRPAPPSSWI